MRLKPRALMLYGFLFLASCAAGMLLHIAWIVDQRPDDVRANLEIVTNAALWSVVLLAVVLAGTFLIVEKFFLKPYYELGRHVENFVLSGSANGFEIDRKNALGNLPVGIQALARAQIDADHAREMAVEKATRTLAEQKTHLEAILADLHEGVVICNLNHQIVLYNKRALELLHVVGEFGLGRSLFSVMDERPFLHALERLTNRLNEGRHETHKHRLSTQFIASTTRDHSTLEGRVGLITEDGRPTAYIATFEDNTKEIAALAKRDGLLRDSTEGLRQPVAKIRVAAEALAMNGDMPETSRQAFIQIIETEVGDLSETLDGLAKEYRNVIAGPWPLANVHSANLLHCVVRRLRREKNIDCAVTGVPDCLHGDSYTLVELLYYLIHRVHEALDISDFHMECDASASRRVNIDIVWAGPAIQASDLEGWLGNPLPNMVGGMTAREILDRHKTNIWSRSHGEGRARLRIPLPRAEEAPDANIREDIPSRPEFYDFGILRTPVGFADTPLKKLGFVVFDLETTGLRPSEGDKIVSIAGVRVVNGRILTGEVFSELVNPGKTIPKESTRFHGITDEMVHDKPSIEKVLPRFHDYVQDAVLVAHNAAFDMKFLKLSRTSRGPNFDNPVICTMLLSKFLHGHTDAHSIDDLCDRFGLTVDGRHTALGDALATARILLLLIDFLEAEGVTTLDQAVEAENQVAELKVLERRF